MFLPHPCLPPHTATRTMKHEWLALTSRLSLAVEHPASDLATRHAPDP